MGFNIRADAWDSDASMRLDGLPALLYASDTTGVGERIYRLDTDDMAGMSERDKAFARVLLQKALRRLDPLPLPVWAGSR